MKQKLYIVYFSPRCDPVPLCGKAGCVFYDCYQCPCLSCIVYPDGDTRVKVTEEQLVFFKNHKIPIDNHMTV